MKHTQIKSSLTSQSVLLSLTRTLSCSISAGTWHRSMWYVGTTLWNQTHSASASWSWRSLQEGRTTINPGKLKIFWLRYVWGMIYWYPVTIKSIIIPLEEEGTPGCSFAHGYCKMSQVWERWTAGTVLDMMDRCLNTSVSKSGVLRCIHVGLLCVQENPADRPLMSSVVVMLGSDTVSLSAPSKPAFYAN
jgi:hypothetical protein